MKLAFYKADNSQNYDCCTFNLDCDEDEVFEKLNLLSDDEFRLYDLEHTLDVFDFEYDVNHGVLGDGWLCTVIL